MTHAAAHVTQAGETYLSHTDVARDGEKKGKNKEEKQESPVDLELSCLA